MSKWALGLESCWDNHLSQLFGVILHLGTHFIWDKSKRHLSLSLSRHFVQWFFGLILILGHWDIYFTNKKNNIYNALKRGFFPLFANASKVRAI